MTAMALALGFLIIVALIAAILATLGHLTVSLRRRPAPRKDPS